MTDLTTVSFNKLKVLEALIKLEINSGYLVNPAQETHRYGLLIKRLTAIRSEIRKRQTI